MALVMISFLNIVLHLATYVTTLTNLKGTRCREEFWVTCEDETGRSTNHLHPSKVPSLTCIIRIITTNES